MGEGSGGTVLNPNVDRQIRLHAYTIPGSKALGEGGGASAPLPLWVLPLRLVGWSITSIYALSGTFIYLGLYISAIDPLLYYRCMCITWHKKIHRIYISRYI